MTQIYITSLNALVTNYFIILSPLLLSYEYINTIPCVSMKSSILSARVLGVSAQTAPSYTESLTGYHTLPKILKIQTQKSSLNFHLAWVKIIQNNKNPGYRVYFTSIGIFLKLSLRPNKNVSEIIPQCTVHTPRQIL